MSLKRKAFEPQKLEEERKDDIFTIRLNKEERAWLQEAKRTLNLNRNSSAMKILAELGWNVIHSSFGAKNLQFLTDKRRIREIVE